MVKLNTIKHHDVCLADDARKVSNQPSGYFRVTNIEMIIVKLT
jgi:hypothetical protein